MANFITTRNTNQCRMFHAKMTKRFGNLGEIVNFLRANTELNDQKSENLESKFEEALGKEYHEMKIFQ